MDQIIYYTPLFPKPGPTIGMKWLWHVESTGVHYIHVMPLNNNIVLIIT